MFPVTAGPTQKTPAIDVLIYKRRGTLYALQTGMRGALIEVLSASLGLYLTANSGTIPVEEWMQGTVGRDAGIRGSMEGETLLAGMQLVRSVERGEDPVG